MGLDSLSCWFPLVLRLGDPVSLVLLSLLLPSMVPLFIVSVLPAQVLEPSHPSTLAII